MGEFKGSLGNISRPYPKKSSWRLTPVILNTWEAKGWQFKASLGKQFVRPHLQNNQTTCNPS
jgi:hypothetical protein